jgi:putative transposase
LRGRYPHLPSHYIHTACQDASTRIKSFNKLKKKSLAKSEKPVVNRVSIWLDDHLWKRIGYTIILIYTHKGWVPVELSPHKLYWRYINSGWILRTQPKIKLDHRHKRLLVYLVFVKSLTSSPAFRSSSFYHHSFQADHRFPHLFGFTSVIWGAVGVARDPPGAHHPGL